jgi:hypothetical protein
LPDALQRPIQLPNPRVVDQRPNRFDGCHPICVCAAGVVAGKCKWTMADVADQDAD